MNIIFFKESRRRKWLHCFMAFFLSFLLAGCGAGQGTSSGETVREASAEGLDETASSDSDTSDDGESAEESDEGSPSQADSSDQTDSSVQTQEPIGDEDDQPAEDGVYTSRDEVALYISVYGYLPSNFITKKEAQALGWEGGSLEPYAPGKCIGGNRFGNYEGLLPEKDGRTYTECDIDTLGANGRGAKRIVFSNDGLIYYTEDHYESFELLYGEE